MNWRFGYRLFLLALAAGAVFTSTARAAHSSSPAPGAAAHGGPSPGYLGVDLRDISEEQASAHPRDIRGAEIVLVDHDAPAGKAGLREHDIVLKINGQAIATQDQARRILHDCQPASAVVLFISREGQLITVTAKMSTREEVERQAWSKHVTIPGKEDPLPTTELGSSGNGTQSVAPSSPTVRGGNSFMGSILMNSSYTGAMLEQMSKQLAEYFGSATGSGVLVRSVVDNSPAAAAGLHAGDVVVQANGKKVGSTGDWAKAVKGSHGQPFSVIILRDKKEQTLTLTPDGKHRSCLEERFQTQERTMLAYLSFSWFAH